jgi:hypothetical protein
MKNGGKRPGAGRPKGSTNKVNIYDYWTRADIDEYFEYLKDAYKESDKLNQFVGEQLMGKAMQAIDHTTNGKDLPTPITHVLRDDSNEENKGTQEEN